MSLKGFFPDLSIALDKWIHQLRKVVELRSSWTNENAADQESDAI